MNRLKHNEMCKCLQNLEKWEKIPADILQCFYGKKCKKCIFFYKKSYKSSKIKSQKLYNSLLF